MTNPSRNSNCHTQLWLRATETDRGPCTARNECGLVDMTGLEFERTASRRVLIIEDEPFIALDLVEVVESLGHNVISVARTLTDALTICQKSEPELIVSDIQLSDGSSGIDAVNEILQSHSVPVVFISAFLEELTTENRPVPLITISKPFRPKFVREAINQAIAFNLEAQTAEGRETGDSLDTNAQPLANSET